MKLFNRIRAFWHFWRQLRWPWRGCLILVMVIFIGVCAFIILTIYSQTRSNSPQSIGNWFDNEESRSDMITRREGCPGAPFLLPSEGFIGLLWRDPAGPYNVLRRHTGIDIFGDGEPGTVPVYAAYDGYLTRLDGWLSSVIIAHEDPLQSDRQIWTYYTHMASRDGTRSYIVADFPAGTGGKFVTKGTLLGYQGEYAGAGAPPIGMHLHMSIVTSEPDGTFRNEADLTNTLDPSLYFGLALNIDNLPTRPIRCNNS
jgi:peptidoglycan LD-endopeptidase LytH